MCHTIQCRSVEHIWMDVSLSIEILLINICPIKSYPIDKGISGEPEFY